MQGIDSVMYDVHSVPKIDWTEASRENGWLDKYVSELAGRLSPFLDRALDSVQQVDDEIAHVSNLMLLICVCRGLRWGRRSVTETGPCALSIQSKMARRA